MQSNITEDPEMRRLYKIAWEQAREELKSHPWSNSIGIFHVVGARAREIFKAVNGVEWPEPKVDPLDRIVGNIRN